MNFTLALLLIFLSTTTGTAAMYLVVSDFVRRDEARARARVHSEFTPREVPIPRVVRQERPVFKDLDQIRAPGMLEKGSSDKSPQGSNWGTSLRRWLQRITEHSGVPLSVKQLLRLSSGASVLLGLAGVLVQGGLSGEPFRLPTLLFGGVVGLVVGGGGPILFVWWKARFRQDRLLKQLPGAFDLMARVLRGGHSVPQAIQAVADAFEDPMASEFASCREQQKLGLMPEFAYEDLAQRTGLLEMKIFAMAMIVQRETGGNLAEVLERLAGLVRARVRLWGRVRTLTAEGRLQATVLLVLPFALYLAMRMVNREYADALFDYPWLLAGTAATMAVGALWIRNIGNIDI